MDNPREQTLSGFLREFRREITAYIEARLELTRLTTYDKTAQLASATIFFVIATGLATVFIILISIALSIFLGKLMGEAYLGFAAVAGIYLLMAVLLFLFRKQISNSIQMATLDILMKSDEKKHEKNDDLPR